MTPTSSWVVLEASHSPLGALTSQPGWWKVQVQVEKKKKSPRQMHDYSEECYVHRTMHDLLFHGWGVVRRLRLLSGARQETNTARCLLVHADTALQAWGPWGPIMNMNEKCVCVCPVNVWQNELHIWRKWDLLGLGGRGRERVRARQRKREKQREREKDNERDKNGVCKEYMHVS